MTKKLRSKKKAMRHILVLILAIIIPFSTMPAMAFAVDSSNLSITMIPKQTSLNNGEILEIDVWINGDEPFIGAQFCVEYEPAQLEYMGYSGQQGTIDVKRNNDAVYVINSVTTSSGIHPNTGYYLLTLMFEVIAENSCVTNVKFDKSYNYYLTQEKPGKIIPVIPALSGPLSIALNVYTNQYDLNKDKVVDIIDLTIITQYYMYSPTHPDWMTPIYNGVRPVDCDFNKDGVVDLLDITGLILNFT